MDVPMISSTQETVAAELAVLPTWARKFRPR